MLLIAVLLVGAAALAGRHAQPAARPDHDDEIVANYGDQAGTMVLHWRGPDATVFFGRDESYGGTATATAPVITPVDIAGPFREAKIDGLTAGTVYHYKIGDGADHTFKTSPTGDFTWVDIGDVSSTFKDPAAGSACDTPWVADHWRQIAQEKPDFLTFGGDISYANKCGAGSVHQFFNDIKPVSTIAPMEFAWGNHEYGGPTSPPAPKGTPRDRLDNYKGRLTMPNAQTLANDTPSRLNHPGCPAVAPATTNSCQGEDWGWFDASGIRFFLWPEGGEYQSTADAKAKSDPIMQAAQNDPKIRMIVIVAHRPVFSSISAEHPLRAELQDAVDTLHGKYPKLRLYLGHHLHGAEAMTPKNGVTYLTDGGGGVEEVRFPTKPGAFTSAGSVFHSSHPSHLLGTVSGNKMTLKFICGPVYGRNPTKDACTQGDVMFTVNMDLPAATG
ncbi:hypothetical protein [Paenarthrobacter sp. Z7-10]|uniref:hypothetical protein n=1 Tax=Paenarthrobacter sp. Z7-10 TaxID=2787635 RepID=UPI0022A93F0E|nr:hypothetical protein [Paenarthrobacter sp. Z7-10]